MSIRVNLYPVETTDALPYLGRTIAFNNSVYAALYCNMSKAQRRWRLVERVLVTAGATVRSRETMYKVVVQTVLLYGRDSWVGTDVMIKVLEGFHHRVAWQITGMTTWQVGEGVGVVIDGGALGGRGSVSNEGVQLEAAGYHCGVYS